MVKGKAWLGIKDPPAGEGQVGQKNTSLSKEEQAESKKTNEFTTNFSKRNKKARLLEKETSLKAWIQVSFTGLPRIQN